MTPDPNSYIQASVQTLAETLTFKTSDYAPTGEFSNFEKSAEMVGGGMDALSVMLVQVGIKVTRIESIRQNINEPTNFESLKDSLLDLAGYATIAHAYLEYTGSDAAMDAYQEASNEISQAERSWEFDPGLHGHPGSASARCSTGMAHVWRRTGVEDYACMNCDTRAVAEGFDG